VEKNPLYQRIFLGRKLREKTAVGDIEFHRKSSLITTLYVLTLVLQAFFTTLDFFHGETLQCAVNATVLPLLACGYLYLRANGSLAVSAFIIISVLSVHFAYNFLTDINRSMWAYMIPLASFFLLGTVRAALFSSAYLCLLVVLMLFGNAARYPVEFKVRFIAVYLSITVISYFFERFRCKTQDLLKKNHLLLEIQRDISQAMGAEKEIAVALDRVLHILTSRLPDFDCGGIYIIDKEAGELRLVVHKGLSLEFVKVVSVYPAEAPNTKLIMHGSPVYSTHADLGIPLDDVRRKEGLKAIAVVPVQSEGRVIASMNCASHRSSEIPQELRGLLESAAAGIGDAISRMLAEHDLHALSSRTTAMLEAIPDIIMEVDRNKIYTWANRAGCAFFGSDVVGKEASYFFAGEQDTYQKSSPVFSGAEETVYVESWQTRKDGKKRLLAWWCRTLKDESGRVYGALSSARDITDDREVENQLRHALKLEAIGQLAGGVAHDFNNQLTSIMGFADLIRHTADGNNIFKEYADGILVSANRAADLTKQLLAFARKGKYQSVKVDIHQIIGEVFTMFQHTIDKKITLKQHLGASPSTVKGDPSQLHNALLNVALNSRDAMPDGGEIAFSTSLVVLDKKKCTETLSDLSPGTYCVVSIADTGTGMNAETQKHLFEPFFTTKEKGTGMGLPAVYGIVKVHHGAVHFESKVGRGTTVSIYLPAYSSEKDAVQAPEATAVYTFPIGLRVLFVDDESFIRKMASELLKFLGHTAITCENGAKAVEYYRDSWKSVDLVVLDMVMPEMGGKETFAALKKINPAVKVILSSGYSLEGEAEQIMHEGVLGFIQKPYTTAEFAELLASVMRKK
jgi:two-component system, cell cycle sensor histidine kinase and response regulator CckA